MQVKKFSLLFLVSFILGILCITVYSHEKKKSVEGEIPILTTGRPELCLICHKEKIQERAHNEKVLGCSSCHLGNPLASTKREAHQGIVKNPSDLRIVHLTCGQANCHAQDIKKVKNSLMATNHGILSRLIKIFKEEELFKDYPKIKVAHLYALPKGLQKSLALDYYKKLCGSCHLYLEKEKFEGFLAEKGGGCSACHLLGTKEEIKLNKIHPQLTKKVTLEKCVKCHNRSGRIGFTYQGLYEGAQGGIYHKLWMDGRELVEIEGDIHFKAGLVCIDCHTKEEIMGNGIFYPNIEEAIEINCETCHTNKGITKKGKFLDNIVSKGENLYLKSKISDKLHPIKGLSESCKDSFHKRLSCSACHSKYIPQCMGCHIRYDPREKHLDKILGKETLGLWEEHESYRRITDPPLALKGNKIVPIAPGCQDFITLLDRKGGIIRKIESITWAYFEPHSTQKKGRTCESCHQNPKSLGLGYEEEKIFIQNPPLRLSQIINEKGETLVKFNRKNMRGFNRDEFTKIYKVGICLTCHKEKDKIYKKWHEKIACPKFPEINKLSHTF